ncbi:MAG: TonB-dependent receptor [Pseudomonadota bacterium]
MKALRVLCVLPPAMLLSVAGGQALAQQQSGQADTAERSFLEEVVVTGVARGTVKLETSVSVSSMDYSQASKYSPRGVAELYRSLPGMRSEPATGEGNGSIAVRGIPLATGGYKYVQLQEDGLPVLQYGDIIVGNVPNFVRGDFNLARIEAIRGGSASTLTSNAPGGIINHISRTGEEEGGSIGLSFGLDYDELRFDFGYGGPIADDIYGYVGGYWREGEGVREVGYDANSGGHIKANVTKELDDGYIRFYFKHLDENIATYHNFVSVAKPGGGFEPFGGWDGSSESAGTVFRTSKSVTDATGTPITRRPADQITAEVDAFGVEFSRDFDNGVSLLNRFRMSEVSGGQISALPFGAGDLGVATDLGASICGCVNPLVTFAAGPNAGDPYAGLALQYLELDFLNESLDFTVNDLRISWDANDRVTLTGGLYYSTQDIVQNWPNWDRFITTFDGDNAIPLLIVDGDTGVEYSDANGTFSRGLLTRLVDLKYTTLAPYLDLNVTMDTFSINASVRQDEVEVRGVAAGAGGFLGDTVPCDNNADGDTTDPLDVCSVSDLSNGTVHNYDPSYTSYSIGGNWAFTDNQAVFARFSEGGVVVADRLFDGGADRVLAANAGLSDGVDDVQQFELGYKWNADAFDLFVTLFRAETEETQSEVTTGNVFVQEYEANGAEIEAVYHIGDFDINANLTWTDAEIVASDTAPQNVGNQPNRQADYIYTLTPSYTTDRFSLGVSLVGSDDFFIGDTETIKQDAYVLVHAYGTWYVNDNLSLTVNANNLTDEYVASFGEGGIVNFQGQDLYGAEVLNARSISATVKYDF